VTLKTYIVEDNATIKDNLIDALVELADIEAVGCAETELEGRQWLRQNERGWDLAIVDLFLRQGTGLGVLRECLERKANQKVVVLSNYATAAIRLRCGEMGVDAVFDKSNEIDALVTYCLQQCHRGKD
jgi:DNA-binding NarL/FixJ family response regulator